jgi:hypothetical protein
MPQRSKTTLRGAAAKHAAPSLEAAKITSKSRCFAIRAEAARKGIDEALLATESPTSMQRMQTESEAAITNLHLVLDKELDDIWSEFEGSARSALAKEMEAALWVECCQEAYNRVNDASASSAARQIFVADRALKQLNPNVLHSCRHSEQGSAKKARVAITGQGAVASSLSTAMSVREKVLAEAGWKLEKTYGGILDAALAQQRKAHGPIIPMLPPLLGLPFRQECSDAHIAATIQQAFTYQSSQEGKLGSCAAFATLFCQQALPCTRNPWHWI